MGDITVIKNDGEVEIVEVKSSNASSGRVGRQKQRMREVTALLRDGRGTLEGQEVSIIRFDVALDNDLPTLLSILEEAGHSGWAGGRINNCCYIEAIDFRAIAGAEKAWKEGVEQTQKETSVWTENNDVVMRTNSLDILAFTPNCAPFSVFPFPARLCVELLTGAKSYCCLMNLTELGREFERHGWKVEKWPQELMKKGAGRNTPLFKLKRNGMHPEVPPADLMRVQMETIRPQFIIRTLDAVFEMGPGVFPPTGFAVYEGEKNLWA